jgi:hypothetical protein
MRLRPDIFPSHQHQSYFQIVQGSGGPNVQPFVTNSEFSASTSNSVIGSPTNSVSVTNSGNVGNETSPKNVTTNIFIRIN